MGVRTSLASGYPPPRPSPTRGEGEDDLRRPALRHLPRRAGALRAVAAELIEPMLEIDAVAAEPALGEDRGDVGGVVAGAEPA